jgi:predicted PurR-regulated permease PerM
MKRTDVTIPSIFYVIMIITGLVVIIAGMMNAKAVLNPLMMAIFIAIVCSGPISWFKEKGFPEWLALFMILTFLCGVGLLAVIVIGSSVKDFLHNIPEYETELRQQMDQLYIFMSSKGVHLKDKGLMEIIKPEAAMTYAGKLFNELGALLANGFIVLLMVVFILLEAGGLPVKLRVVYGTDDKHIHQLQKFSASVRHYMSIKSMVSFATGTLVSICLLVIGVDYPFMWGMLAFAFNFIPNIGSIIAAVPAVLLAMVQLGPGSGLAVAACYLVINIIMGNVVEPRFMGKGLGLSIMVVFFSLLFWGWVFGPVGMLLSVLLTMKLKIMLESSDETTWLALLLGPAPEE